MSTGVEIPREPPPPEFSTRVDGEQLRGLRGAVLTLFHSAKHSTVNKGKKDYLIMQGAHDSLKRVNQRVKKNRIIVGNVLTVEM